MVVGRQTTHAEVLEVTGTQESSGDTILNREFRTLATYSDPATFPRALDGQIKHFNVA